MNFLEVVDGQGRRLRIELDRPRLLIGREPNCDIHLPHPGVSRRHAQLQKTDQGRWLLQDLNSRNHVYVENRAVQQAILEPRKPFRIAEYWLSLQEDRPEGEAEPAFPDMLGDTAELSGGQEVGWLEQLQTFQKSLGHVEEPHVVIEQLGREFRRVLQPQVLAIGLAKGDGYHWELVQTEEKSGELKGHLQEADKRVADDHSSIQTWTPMTTNNGETPSPAPPQCLLFPMRGRLGIIGHVYVARPCQSPVPRPLQRYLSVLATQAGLIWDNLQLALLRQTQLDFEKELHQARQIQIDLFPATFEVDNRLDAFAVNLPSAKVSGDYYDLIRVSPDTVAFVIADAMGHGMPAALMMAAVRAALRMGLTLDLPWTAVFQGLDDLIRQARSDTFVTGLVGLVDLRSHELSLVSAGHPLPSILIDGHPATAPQECLTRPWGLDIDTYWEVSKISLKGKRWSILCYTDGITDASARTQRTFGAQRIAAYHKKHYQACAEDLCQGLLSEIAVQPKGVSLRDDQTVLVLCSKERATDCDQGDY
jgi:serine phosphatase RsbU (regulator of sigma subunit)